MISNEFSFSWLKSIFPFISAFVADKCDKCGNMFKKPEAEKKPAIDEPRTPTKGEASSDMFSPSKSKSGTFQRIGSLFRKKDGSPNSKWVD